MRRWWGCRGRRYKVGGMEIRDLKARVGCECCISRRGPDGPDWAVEVYKLEKSKEEVTVLVGVGSPKKAGMQQGGQLREWELPSVLNLEKESSEHFKWTQLEHMQHCTDLPRQVTFPGSAPWTGKDGKRVRMNVAAHQKKEKKNEKTGKRKSREERRQADFKEAACYPSAVVQGTARRKNGLCEGCARGNWDPWEDQQPFRPNPNGLGTAPSRWGGCWLV